MDGSYEQTTQGRIMMIGVFVIFTLVLLVSFYTAYEQKPGQNLDSSSQETILGNTQGQNVSLEDVATDPNAFIGQVVSVRGEVGKNIGTRGITVKSSGKNPEDILIVSRESLVGVGGGPGEGEYKVNDGVRVWGEVRTFNLHELEDEIGAPLNEEAYRMYEGKPVIIANTIVPLQEF
jgi:predicted acyltransferase (DUF342 family)